MINSAHLHLLLVHIPIVLFPLAVVLLLVSRFSGNRTLSTAACYILIFAAAVAGGAYLAGEGAEELVEELAGVVESNIETHDEAAEVALILSSITAALAALALIPSIIGRFTWITKVVLPLALISSVCLAWVGYLGGKVRHPEAFDAKVVTGSREEEEHH